MKRFAIKNGTIIDGTAAAPFRGNLVVQDQEIESVGRDGELSADFPVIDAAGDIVCPGFIDTHSHSDVSLLVNPDADSALYQGVTTEIIGNCGLSLFPVTETTKDLLLSYVVGLGYDPGSFPIEWTDLDGYAAAFEKNGCGINVVPLVGHGAIRIAVMGFETRKATPPELAEMKDHFKTALDQGVWGLSSGLVYPPGINAPADELEALCKMAADRDRLYTTHLRGDTLRNGPSFVDSLAEALSVLRKTGVRLHVSHAAPKFPNTGAVTAVVQMMQGARDEGFLVSCDAHPYLAAMTFLASLLPPWAFEGGVRNTVRRLNDPEERARIVKAVNVTFEHLNAADFWPRNEILLPDLQSEFNHHRLDVIAQKLGMEPAEALVEILARSGENLFEVMVLQWIYSAAETRELFSWPHTMVGADGATSSLGHEPGPLTMHPRSWGTFPKVIRDYNTNTELLPLADVIYRMTGLPAATMGLADRGTLQPKKKADIVVFNLDQLKDAATYEHPFQYAQGVKYLWVNGCLALDHGKPTGQRPGKFLRQRNNS